MTDSQDAETEESATEAETEAVLDAEATGDALPEVDDETMELVAAHKVDTTMREILADQLGSNIDAEGVPDYYDVFDWDPNPSATDYYAMALRNPYAFAVTFLPAMTAWRDPPQIVDDAEGADGQTQFEKELQTLERTQNLWNVAARADMLAGIGTFGVLVLQFDDIERGDVGSGEKYTGFGMPVSNPSNLTGLKPFSRTSVEDVVLGGPGSGRWGEPLRYKLRLGDENDTEFSSESTGPETMWVHHSRVIHIHSDQLLDDNVRGIPRQQPVYNNLVDIEKTLGSAGTLAYRASAWGININISKDFSIDDETQEKLRKHLARWQSGLENVLRTHGADDVKSLGGEDIDPQPVIDPNVEAISAQTKIPQSVLKGNETGERSTTQDLKDWYGNIQERREQYLNSTIVREIIDRLIQYSILSAPRDGPSSYSVEWDPLWEMSEKDEADIQHTRAQALNEWTGGMPEAMLTREQQAEYIESGTLPSEFDDVSDDVEELEAAAAAGNHSRSVEEMTADYRGDEKPAATDGGEEASDE